MNSTIQKSFSELNDRFSHIFVKAFKMNSVRFCFLLLLLFSFSLSAQVNLDSLWSVWNDPNQADTNKLKAMKLISWDGYLFTHPDSAFHFAQLQYDYAKKKDLKRYMAIALNTQGVSFHIKGNYSEAIDYYSKSVKIWEELGDKQGIANTLNNIGIIHYDQGKYSEAIDSYSKSLKIREELGDKQGIANTLNNIGNIHADQGNYSEAIDYYSKSLKIREEIGDKKGISVSLNNVGTIHKAQGNYSEAIAYYSKSLKVFEEFGDKKGISGLFNNIGTIHYDQGNYSEAIAYYSKSLKIREEIGDKQGISVSLNNIGEIHADQGNYSEAIAYYSKSLKIREEIGDKKGISSSLNNIGEIHYEQGNYSEAIDSYSKSLKICEEIGDKRVMSISLNNIGLIRLNQGNYSEALKKGKQALKIAGEIDAKPEIKKASKLLWEVHKELGDSKEALTMYELYITTRDSIESEENQRAVIRQEFQYNYEKKAAADSVKAAEETKVKDAQLAAEQAENVRRKQQSYFLYGGLVLALIFGGFIFNRYKVTNQQKEIITKQKQEVDKAYVELEDKNQKILDSITYAKRIQNAILPPIKVVKEYLHESFIIYLPKDVVAGDFYWLETLQNKTLFAAADCTGHGVPGAMVSVVCNNGLNRSVREYEITDPGKILDKTREIVVQEFEKSEEEVKDGMDIALCSLEGKTLEYAGAHNPLIIIRKDSEECEVIKPNKEPIGQFDNPQPYTSHKVELHEGDSIYLFSDGFQDQFGGPKGKKFMIAQFKKLLVEVSKEPMEKQKEIILKAFNDWKGNVEQVDDVCVIGVRV